MPQIKINEVDTSTTSGLAVTTNTVYVPGYAIMGPINTPTLCNSVDEFERIFGSTPYYFEEPQTNWYGNLDTAPVDAVIRQGSAEKSYIYAHELLEQGLPVLFERVFDDDKVNTFTSVAQFDATTYEPPVIDTLAWEVVDEFNASKTYSENDKVVYEGTVYSLINDNQGNRPTGEASDTNWEAVVATDWAPSNVYAAGAVVKYFDTFYVRTVSTAEQKAEYIKLSSKDPGKASFLIKARLVAPTGDSKVYKLIVSRDASASLRLNKIEDAETRFTFDFSTAQVSTVPFYEELSEDKSGLVKFEWGIQNEDVAFASATKDLNKNADGKVIEKTTASDELIDSIEFEIEDIYKKFMSVNTTDGAHISIFDKLTDKGEYVFKYLTSGAYPVLDYANASAQIDTNEIASRMVEVAAVRGDITAIIDPFNQNESILTVASKFKEFVKAGDIPAIISEYGSEPAYKYGTGFYPYGIFRNSVIKSNIVMPGSFNYLSAFANAVKSNPNYYATAGVKRGVAPKLVQLCVPVTNAEAEVVQPDAGVSINPTTDVKPYGLRIWGTRTLFDSTLAGELVASSFLNVRQLANDIKRALFVASKELTFEQNNDILWINFKSKITPMLDQMMSNGGIAGYELKRIATTKRATLKAKIKIFAIEPVENFDLTLDVSDNVLTVAE